MKRGDYAKAARLLEFARAMAPANPVVSDHLASVYWVLGRRAEAEFEWKKALVFLEKSGGKHKGELSEADLRRRILFGYEG